MDQEAGVLKAGHQNKIINLNDREPVRPDLSNEKRTVELGGLVDENAKKIVNDANSKYKRI